MIKLIELARSLGISVEDSAIDHQGNTNLRHRVFWKNLKYQAVFTLKKEVVKALCENGELYIGREIYFGEDVQTIVKIREEGVTLKDALGNNKGSWSLLYMGFDFSKLPGDDPDGHKFWENREKRKRNENTQPKKLFLQSPCGESDCFRSP